MSSRAGNSCFMAQRPLPGLIFRQAVRAYEREEYEESLVLIGEGMDLVQGQETPGEAVVLLPDPDSAKVCDAVVLWANNLFQLDRFNEFEVLLASAGRWGLVPEEMPELDLVVLSFAFKQGKYTEVVVETTTFIEKHRQGSLPIILADFLLLRSHCLSNLGEPEKAEPDAEMAYSLFRLLGNDKNCARAANLQGMLCGRNSHFDTAEVWFRRSFDLHQQLDMKKNMGGNRLNLGIINYKRGDLVQAEIEFQAAQKILTQVKAQVPLCRCAIARGNNLRLQRNFDIAREVLTQAYNQANELTLAREEALALEFLGDTFKDEKKYDQARRFYSRALAIGNSLAPDGDIVMEVMGRQGECLSLMGRHREGISVLGRALVLARRLGDKHEEGVVRRSLAQAMFETSDHNQALQHISRAVDLFEQVGAQFDWALALIQQCKIQLAQIDGGMVEDTGKMLELAWQGTLKTIDPFSISGVDHWLVQARAILSDVSKRRSRWEKLQLDGWNQEIPQTSSQRQMSPPIIHVSSGMRDLIQLTDAFADSEEPVLITGETGTGKELFARRLHDRSRRRSEELVCVNVTAIPNSIFAREFFGHVQGSFSGADRDGLGLAAKADGGTLFLDEIGEMPLELQPQLLRLLQDGTYHAIGDPQERRTNIRLVAATNANLEQLVAEGKFRADLYYRLKILGLKLPSIPKRREDIQPLLKHFLSSAAGRSVETQEFFNQESLDQMQNYRWPGNVREIAMVARQARVQMASTGQVCVEVGEMGEDTLFFSGPQKALSAFELPQPGRAEHSADFRPQAGLTRSKIMMSLDEAKGNRAEAARILGVSRSTLYRHLVKLGVATKIASG
ncbi:MAG: tetratricopeptide repeat protein [bacterium]|nr:tetratricopeptide repeat protein [bacterium]